MMLGPSQAYGGRQEYMVRCIRNIPFVAVLMLTVLSGYLFLKLSEKASRITELSTIIKKRNMQIMELIKELRDKVRAEAELQAAKARMTPAQFGVYLAEGDSPLRPLDRLSVEKRDLPLDFPKYTDKPQLIVKHGVPAQIVLYDRIFSFVTPSKLLIRIVAKVRGEDAWVLRDRGYETQVSPRADNRDILDIFLSYKPGRYAIELGGKYYAFTVEGDSDDSAFCVEKRTGIFQNVYVRCRAKKPL